MNWRRGVIFANIHLAICSALVVWVEAGFWLRSERFYVQPATNYQRTAFQKDQIEIIGEAAKVDLDCRGLWYHMPLQQRIINIFEVPAALIAGWEEPCPARWTLTANLGLSADRRSRSREIASASILLFLIAAQWIAIGGIPLIHPRTWYFEPGCCITVCLVFVTAIAVFESLLEAIHFRWTEGFMLAPGLLGLLAMALALLGWLWYFALLLWKPVHLAWQSTLHGLQRLRY